MSNSMTRIVLICLLLSFAFAGCRSTATPIQTTGKIEWAAFPTPDQTKFEHAGQIREFRFPVDHGAHPDFQTEWWYFTGVLQGDSGKKFGYQLTFFRRALIPQSQVETRTSDLAVDQIYMAHFAVTDIAADHFHATQRVARGDGRSAGVTVDPFIEVWLDDWDIKQVNGTEFKLLAKADNIGIDLILDDRTGVQLQGYAGLSRKSATTASYYYSIPVLNTNGTINLDGKVVTVYGSSWMDHEFSTSALAPDQVGWDWFALHLDNEQEIMVYTIRKNDGSIDPYSSGTIMQKGQSPIPITLLEFDITRTNAWKSPHSGAGYPSGWKLSIPSKNIELTISPYIKDQELNLSFTYWEGAVDIQGTINGKPVHGSGYVELTGYASSMNGQF